MNSLSLWQISLEMERIGGAVVEASDNDDIEEVEQLLKILDATSESFDEKALQVAAYIRHLRRLGGAQAVEGRRFLALAKKAEKAEDSLRDYLAREMERIGKAKVSGVSGEIRLQRKPETLIIDVAEDEIPDEFVKVTRQPDRAAIKAAIKSDPQFSHLGHLQSLGYSVRIS